MVTKLYPYSGVLAYTDFFPVLVNPNQPGRFLKFSKSLTKKFKSISPQLRVPEEQTIARLKGLILGFHFGQVSPCRRAPLPSEFSSFSGTSLRAGACSNNRIL